MADIEILVAADSDTSAHLSVITHAFASGVNLVIGYVQASVENYAFATRFQNVPIPRGARIRSAVIRLEAEQSDAEVVVRGRIDGLASGNSETPTHAEFDGGVVGVAGHGRNTNNRTRAQVLWDGIVPVTIGVDYDTPDISAVVQEITSRPDWVYGNAMTFFIGDEDEESDQLPGHNRQFLYTGVGPRLVASFDVDEDPAHISVALGSRPLTLTRGVAGALRQGDQAQVE